MEKTKMDQALEAWETLGRWEDGWNDQHEAYSRTRHPSVEGQRRTLKDLLDRAVAKAARSDEEIPAEFPPELEELIAAKRDKIRFAQEVRDRLLAKGLSEQAVKALFGERSAGPGAAERALEWAREIQGSFCKDAVALALNCASARFGVERHIAALQDLGFPSPPVMCRQFEPTPSARDFNGLCMGVLALQRFRPLPPMDD